MAKGPVVSLVDLLTLPARLLRPVLAAFYEMYITPVLKGMVTVCCPPPQLGRPEVADGSVPRGRGNGNEVGNRLQPSLPLLGVIGDGHKRPLQLWLPQSYNLPWFLCGLFEHCPSARSSLAATDIRLHNMHQRLAEVQVCVTVRIVLHVVPLFSC